MDADPQIRSLCCTCDDVVVDFSYLSASSCFSGTPPGLKVGDVLYFSNESKCVDRTGWFINGELVSTDEDFTWFPSEGGTFTVTLKGRLGDCEIQEKSETFTVYPGCYCTSSGANSANAYLNSFCFTDICVGSGDDGGYAFNDINFTAGAGDSIPVAFDPVVTSPFSTGAYLRIWIDYNQNGSFEDPAELAYSGIGTGFTSGDIVIPGDAMGGQTLMRVQMKKWLPVIPVIPAPTPCEHFAEGEVEDYLLTILTPRLANPELDQQFEVWPNPATDQVTVQLTSQLNGEAKVSLIDMQGRLVMSSTVAVQEGSNNMQLSVDGLAEGLYILNIQVGESVQQQRISVVR